MKRREFITLLGGAAATWPLAARAQQREQLRRIGVLMSAAIQTDQQAGVAVFKEDSTEESQSFFERVTEQMAKTGVPPVAWRLFLGDDFPAMAHNQVRNVTERRIRTVSFICVA